MVSVFKGSGSFSCNKGLPESFRRGSLVWVKEVPDSLSDFDGHRFKSKFVEVDSFKDGEA